MAKARRSGKRDVLGDRIVEHETVALAVLRDEIDAMRDGVRGRPNRDRLAIEPDLASEHRDRCRTERGRVLCGRRRSARPCPESRRRATKGSRRALDGLGSQARDLQEHFFSGRRLRRNVERLEVAPDHQTDHGVAMDLAVEQARRRPTRRAGRRRGRRRLPTSFSRWVMKMTDTPSALSSRDDTQQPIGLGRRQAGRRLVHDDDARVQRKRLGDLQKLPLGEREVGDEIIDPEIDVKPLQQRRRRRACVGLRSTSFSGPANSGSRPMRTFAPTSRFSNRLSS